MKKKVIIFVPVLLVLVAGSLWALKKTPFITGGTSSKADMSAWPLYRNEKYRFELRYPPNTPFGTFGEGADVVPPSSGNALDTSNHIALLIGGDTFDVQAVTSTMQNDKVDSAKQAAETQASLLGFDDNDDHLTEVKIPGVEGVAYQVSSLNNGKTWVFLSNRGEAFEVAFNPSEPVQKAIFGSFHFY